MRSLTAFIVGLSIRAKLALLAGVLLFGQMAVNAAQYVSFQRFRVGGIAYTGLKAETDSVDALSSVLLDVYRLDSALRGLGERPAAGELERARALVAEVDERAAARFALVRRLQAGSGGGDPVRDAAAAWDSVHASILGRLSPGAPFDGRSFTAFLDGPQRLRYAHLVEALDDAAGRRRQRALQFEEVANANVQRAVVMRVALGVSLGAILLAMFLLVGRAILRPISSLVHLAERVSQGDLSVELPPASGDELGRVAESLGKMVRALRAMVGTLAGSAADVGDAIARMRSVAHEQVSGTQRQATAVRQTQAIAEEIRQSSRVASQRTEQLRRTADAAVQVGQRGAASLEASRGGIETIKTGIDEIGDRIDSLDARARSLGRVVRTIKDLTDQMNMLALNAAMEAMRAGTHGRAFAVVAREMRSLTDRAAESTEQIAHELAGTSEALRQAVAAAERGRSGMNVGLSEIEAGAHTLQQLSQLVSQSSSGVGEIATAVGEQDQGIGQVFGALTELTATLEQGEDNASRIRETITLLESAAARVRDAAGTFRV